MRRSRSVATEVAKLAGVSQSAVSRAFTEGASISEETRRKVVEAANALGYRPNYLARTLITRRSRIIGVAVGYLDNGFYPAVLEALSQRLDHLGYRILLFTTDLRGEEDPSIEEILSYHVDALILASTVLTSRLAEECRRAGTPVILFNRTTEMQDASSVTGDNYRGARTVAAFLHEGGHRRFAYLAGLENSSTSRDRERGFFEYLTEQGYHPPQRVVGSYTFEGAMAATRTLLSGKNRPDALFCANDHMALAAIQIAREEFGLAIGRDISIVGFDDAPAAAWPGFALTTYAQPIGAMVDVLVEMMVGVLSDAPEAARHEIVPGELVVRRSARLPAKGLVERDGRTVWRPQSV